MESLLNNVEGFTYFFLKKKKEKKKATLNKNSFKPVKIDFLFTEAANRDFL